MTTSLLGGVSFGWKPEGAVDSVDRQKRDDCIQKARKMIEGLAKEKGMSI
ncbi:MAG: hypothetical protein NTV33_05230 [Coprothermobacterota bacterium]|nr:hypothetical protein [Coprothermobacterota bacterium]